MREEGGDARLLCAFCTYIASAPLSLTLWLSLFERARYHLYIASLTKVLWFRQLPETHASTRRLHNLRRVPIGWCYSFTFFYCQFRGLLGSRSAPPFHNARRVANGQITPQNIISFLNPTYETESAAYTCPCTHTPCMPLHACTHACIMTELVGLSFPKADFTTGPQIIRPINSISSDRSQHDTRTGTRGWWNLYG